MTMLQSTSIDVLDNLSKVGIQDRGPFRRAALKGYIKRMSKNDPTALFDKFVAQTLSKQGITWEYDPRSIYEVDQLYAALERYGPANAPVIAYDPALRKGIDMAWKVFAKPENYPIDLTLKCLSSYDELIDSLDLSKSAGLPNLGSKADDIVYAIDREYQIRSGEKSPNPCLAGARTSAGNRTRLVWMFPLEMTIMEARFARPLIDHFIESRTTMAFGLYKYELGSQISWEIETQGIVHCLDYSKFDSSIPRFLIKTAFNIMATWFRPEEMEEYGWKIIEEYFINTPIVMPNGRLYTGKRHGVPSGSYFTQLVDSIVNTILIGALFYAFGVKKDWHTILVLGDDSIFAVDWELPLDKVRNFLSRYGITVNTGKTKVGTSHFLGADWIKCLSHRDPSELANRIVQPESFRKYDFESPIEEQVNNVIANYASQYIEAFKFIDLNYVRVDLETQLGMFCKMSPSLLTGSDRYRWRTLQKAGRLPRYSTRQDPTSVPTLRILT